MKIKKNKNSSPEKYDLNLEEGKIYVVYSLAILEDVLWYAICENNQTFYPLLKPSTLFDIVDNRLSRYWIFNIWGVSENINKEIPILSFPEWAKDPYFYGELIEDNSNDPNAIIFKKYKELMDLEFPDPSISETAQIGDAEWLICPKCIDAWQSKNDRDALVKCPKCKTIFNNPRYRDEWPQLPCDPIKFKIA